MGGLFDDARNFIAGLLVRAEASHILIKGNDAESALKITEIQKKLLEQESECSADGMNTNKAFAAAAALHSHCQSGRSQGGSLGEFGRFSMTPEFGAVVFNKDSEVGVVHGPIETSFGYHLILITSRSDTTPKATDTTDAATSTETNHTSNR